MSCLFNSLAAFMHERDSFRLRNSICNYLADNNPIIDGLDTKFVLDMEDANYIENMRNPNTWGGAIEIQAACNIWKMRVLVLDTLTNKKIEFLPVNDTGITTIEVSWNGSHYEPIKPPAVVEGHFGGFQQITVSTLDIDNNKLDSVKE